MVLGLAGNTLLVAYASLCSTRAATAALATRLGILALVLVLLWLPLAGIPAIAYVRGTLGDLSVTTVLLLVLGCWSELTGRALGVRNQIRVLMLGALTAGLTLYPWSVGLTRVDPYSWGYGSYMLVGVLSSVAVVCWLRQAYLVVTALLLATTAYLLQLGESTNLWDYLVDPLLVLFALVWFGTDWVKFLRRRLSRRAE
jgi:hypothetical protein